MAYTVVIEYKPVEGLAEQFAMPVCGLYNPTSSYIDSAVYEDGHTVASENESTLAKKVLKSFIYPFSSSPVSLTINFCCNFSAKKVLKSISVSGFID